MADIISSLSDQIGLSKLGHLVVKGQSTSIDPQTNKRYPLGYTPPEDFIAYPENVQEDGKTPVEYGLRMKPSGYSVDTNDLLTETKLNSPIVNNNIPDAFNAFKDNYDFLHGLDPDFIPMVLDQYNDVYLSTFVETDTDNEDPVMYGFDIFINYDNSPLFNGAIEDFLNEFPNYAELSSRIDTITEFKKQFFKFFKVNTTNSVKDYVDNTIEPRTYYIKKISGLNNLSESISPDKDSKQFTEYGKDIITLSFYDDVSVNAGYLSFLYKTLTWSKRNGKQMIPDNLLQFDMDIVVTEVRKYNRVIKNTTSTDSPFSNPNGSLSQYADVTSRYNYRIYECQFFFEEFNHGDEIDMYATKLADDLNIKINYKYSTCKFEKMTDFPTTTNNNITIRSSKVIDNSKLNLNLFNGADANTDSFKGKNGNIIYLPPKTTLNKYGIGYVVDYNVNSNINVQTNNNNSIKYSVLDALKQNAIQQSKDLLTNTANNIKKFLPTNILAGFVPGGEWSYNIPFYLENKVFNSVNDNFIKFNNKVRIELYKGKNKFVNDNLNPNNLR